MYGHVITTERLRLRPLTGADVEPLARINADPDVARYLGDGVPIDADLTWRSTCLFIGHGIVRGYSILAIEDRSTGEFLGRSGPWFPAGWPHLEVGWVVDPRFQGRGIATEAARASLLYCFEEIGAEWVCSLIRPANEPSRAVARKLGGTVDRVEGEFMKGPAEVWAHRRATLTAGAGDEAEWEGRGRSR